MFYLYSGKDRANDVVDSNVGGNTQSSRPAHEGKLASASLKTSASSVSNPPASSQVASSQQLSHDGDTGKWRPHFHGDGSAISSIGMPHTTGLGDSQRMTSVNYVINVEQSRDGNVSYPHRVYTVPGTPVSSLTGGEQLLAMSKSLSSSSLSREQIDVDLSALRKQFAAEQSSKTSLASSQAIRQLLPPTIPGSRVFGATAGLVNLRPRLPFEGVGGRSYGQTGVSEPASRLFPPDVAVIGSRVHRSGSEERIFDSTGIRRHDAELQGLLSSQAALPQPELLQRAYPKEGPNSALLVGRILTVYNQSL